MREPTQEEIDVYVREHPRDHYVEKYVNPRSRGRVKAGAISMVKMYAVTFTELRTANEEIAEGTHTYSYRPGTIPGARGATVRYFYEGAPGTWSVDSNGAHWCCGPDQMIRLPKVV